jgi:hypothetical protein
MSKLVAEPRKRGRPVKVSPETWERVKTAKIAGAKDKEICETFGVSMASLMRWLDKASNRMEIEVGRATTAVDILAALGRAAMSGKADAARQMLRRLGRRDTAGLPTRQFIGTGTSSSPSRFSTSVSRRWHAASMFNWTALTKLPSGARISSRTASSSPMMVNSSTYV